MGDGLVDTNLTRDLGTGSCLSALEIQAKERRSDFGHCTGPGGGWVGGTFFGQTLPGVRVSIFLSSSSPL